MKEVGPPITPSKVRIRCRTQTMPPSYYIKKENSSESSSSSSDLSKSRINVKNKKQKFDYLDTNNEIEFIKEVKNFSQKKEPYLIDLEPPSFEKENEVVTKDTPEKFSQTSSSTKSETKPSQSLKKGVEGFSFTASVNEPKSSDQDFSQKFRESSISVSNSSAFDHKKNVLQNKENNANSGPKVGIKPDPIHSVPQNHQSENNIINETKISLPLNKKCQSSHFNMNRQRVLDSKSASIIITNDRMKRMISSFVIQLNTSHYYLSSNHIPVYTYLTSGIKSQELAFDDSLYTSTIKDQNFHIFSKRVGRHKVLIAEPINHKPSADDRLIALQSLEWLQLHIQPDVYPNVVSIGVMLKIHIWKASKINFNLD